MKKTIILLAFIFTVINVFSQDSVVNKKGQSILPKAGDIAIGIDAGPFLQYFGNFLNGNTANADPNLDFLDGTTLFGKYFLEDNRAVRVRIEYTSSRFVDRRYVRDDNAYYQDPLSNAQVVDKQTTRNSDFVLGLEYEMRRGKNRLQGYFGGGVLFACGNSIDKYEYGNPFSQVYPNPTDYNFGTNILANNDRVLVSYNGKSMGAGINGFIGFEYFFMPNISIGGEVGWRLLANKIGQSKYDYETWNGTIPEEKTMLTSPGDNSFSTFSNNPAMGLFILVHF